MTGAYAGGRLAAFVPTGILLTGFGLMMLATAAAAGALPASLFRTSYPSRG
jgi:hypothetical protein